MKKLGNIFCYLVLVAMFVYLAYTGISPFIEKSNSIPVEKMFAGEAERDSYVAGDIHNCTDEIYEVTHTLNLIPTGKDHFFIAFNADLSQSILVKADKNWDDIVERNLSRGVTTKIRGKVKKMDLKFTDDINEIFTEMKKENLNPPVSQLYVDNLTEKYAKFTILCLGIMLICGVIWLVNLKYANVILKKLISFAFFADIIFLLHIMSNF